MKNWFSKFIVAKKGFTIIELIVVIAIIAIIAEIVLTNAARQENKSRDAAIRGDLSTLLTRGTSYFDNNGSYTGFCLSNTGGALIKNAIEASNLGGTFACTCDDGGNNCNSASLEWCACSTLITSSNTFCVDSSGYKEETSNTCDNRCSKGVCSS